MPRPGSAFTSRRPRAAAALVGRRLRTAAAAVVRRHELVRADVARAARGPSESALVFRRARRSAVYRGAAGPSACVLVRPPLSARGRISSIRYGRVHRRIRRSYRRYTWPGGDRLVAQTLFESIGTVKVPPQPPLTLGRRAFPRRGKRVRTCAANSWKSPPPLPILGSGGGARFSTIETLLRDIERRV